jgi:hypothetical protein
MEDLAADLAAFDEAEIDVHEPPPTLAGQEQANRLLRRMALLDAETEAVDRLAQAEIDRINEWRTARYRTIGGQTAWLSSSLEQFMRAHHAAGGGVTLKLPNGELKLRPRTSQVVVDDGDAFVAWAAANGLTTTLTRLPDPPARKPDATRLKQVTVIDKPVDVPEGTPTFALGPGAPDPAHEGRLLHAVMLGDEVVPGVRVSLPPDDRTFSIGGR